MKILILSADHFEDSELLVPLARLREAGMQVDIGSLSAGTIHGKHGAGVQANRAITEIRPEDYDALLLPGGKAPAALREDAQVLALVRHFFAAGKPVAAICHGPQVLIAAGVLAGRTATAYRAVAHEFKAPARIIAMPRWWWMAISSPRARRPTCPPFCANLSPHCRPTPRNRRGPRPDPRNFRCCKTGMAGMPKLTDPRQSRGLIW